ncbi:MAG: hypothetical protein KatS3mg022_0050 [Armatimonadota bacterium]|nr:MAG: hypothetical protein KatS3mg022_0050 [Armatimonadota bacterium]
MQLAYEYAYGFDGGRRWRKDYINGVWTRYPCGVACGAGELVEQQKPLEGGSWTTSALYLQGISLVRRNGEWHHFDPLGRNLPPLPPFPAREGGVRRAAPLSS